MVGSMLKSELGLRPIYHRKPARADGHLFITVIAYQLVQVIRTRLRARREHARWTTLRRVLEGQQRDDSRTGPTCAFPAASGGHGTSRHQSYGPRSRAHVAVIPTRCGSKQAPSRSIAQATLSRRSATERRERACPWPRLRSA